MAIGHLETAFPFERPLIERELVHELILDQASEVQPYTEAPQLELTGEKAETHLTYRRSGFGQRSLNRAVKHACDAALGAEDVPTEVVVRSTNYALDILNSGMLSPKMGDAKRVAKALSKKNIVGLQFMLNRAEDANYVFLNRDNELINALDNEYDKLSLITVGGIHAARTTLRSRLWQRLRRN